MIPYLLCTTFNHSTLKGEVVDLIKYRDFAPYKNYRVKVCSHCGQYICDDINRKTECYTCNSSDMIETPYSLKDMVTFIESTDLTRSNTDIYFGWEERIRNQYCKQSDNYDSQLYDKREAEDYARFAADVVSIKKQKSMNMHKPDPNACPKCGNTQFTPVRQKWNIFTGFRTNKVDLVCNKCGYIKK